MNDDGALQIDGVLYSRLMVISLVASVNFIRVDYPPFITIPDERDVALVIMIKLCVCLFLHAVKYHTFSSKLISIKNMHRKSRALNLSLIRALLLLLL